MSFEIDWQDRCKRMENGIHQIKRQLENFWAAGDCEADDAELQDFVENAYKECLSWVPNDIERVDSFEIDEAPAESSEEKEKPFELENVEVDVQDENTETESDEDVENTEE